MCLAYPGKIISITENHAKVDFDGLVKKINISFVEVKKGDFVIVHAGFAIQKLDIEEADKTIKTFKENNIKFHD